MRVMQTKTGQACCRIRKPNRGRDRTAVKKINVDNFQVLSAVLTKMFPSIELREMRIEMPATVEAGLIMEKDSLIVIMAKISGM